MPFTGQDFLNMVHDLEAKLADINEAFEDIDEESYTYEVLKKEHDKLFERLQMLYRAELDFVRKSIRLEENDMDDLRGEDHIR